MKVIALFFMQQKSVYFLTSNFFFKNKYCIFDLNKKHFYKILNFYYFIRCMFFNQAILTLCIYIFCRNEILNFF